MPPFSESFPNSSSLRLDRSESAFGGCRKHRALGTLVLALSFLLWPPQKALKPAAATTVAENPSQRIELSPALSRYTGEPVDLSTWTLEQKAGQLLLVGFRSLQQVRKIQPAGVILFSWSMKNTLQTHKLTESLKMTAAGNLKSPLFIATDHEGGKVLRLRRGMTNWPDAAAVGALEDPFVAFRVGKEMGHELSALGINMNLAPVLDLGNSRSFLENRVWGSSSRQVAKMTTAFIRGLHAGRVLAVAKHFPGHGGTELDSHFDLPVIKKSFARLWREDLLPFRTAVKDGVQAIMTAHVEIPAVAEGPASLSYEFITKILRERLGFRGLILTDDLEMGGITKRLGYPAEELALQSLKAGTNLVMVVWSQEMQFKIRDRVVKAVREGELSEAWLDGKVRQVLRTKAEVGSMGAISNPYWTDLIRSERASKLQKKIVNGAVLWQGGDPSKSLVPLAKDWKKGWKVVVMRKSAERFWRRFRPQDQVFFIDKRSDGKRLGELDKFLGSAASKGKPFVVVSGPRASSSEAAFLKIQKRVAAWEMDASIKSPLLWIHQGSIPVALKKNAEKLKVGFLSLHSSSMASLKELAKFLKTGGRGLASLKGERVTRK